MEEPLLEPKRRAWPRAAGLAACGLLACAALAAPPAVPVSLAASPEQELLALFARPTFRSRLEKLLPGVDAAPQALFARLGAEIALAEVVHNFDPDPVVRPPPAIGIRVDVTMELLEEHKQMLNVWDLLARNITPPAYDHWRLAKGPDAAAAVLATCPIMLACDGGPAKILQPFADAEGLPPAQIVGGDAKRGGAPLPNTAYGPGLLGTLGACGMNVGRIQEDATQVVLDGATPFAAGPANPTVAEAQERRVYSGLNVYKVDGGSCQGFGAITLVFKNSALPEALQISPSDSGLWYAACGWGLKCPPPAPPPPDLHCPAWDGVEVPRAEWAKLFLSHVKLWKPASGATADYAEANAARLAARLLGRWDDEAFELDDNELNNGYWEPGIGHLSFPGDVRLVVASWGALAGTKRGNDLRAWATRHGLALAWADSESYSERRASPGSSASLRVLDPSVLAAVPAGRNATVVGREQFERQWQIAASAKDFATAGTWAQVVAALGKTAMSIEPLYAGACADPDCVGVSRTTGECFCP